MRISYAITGIAFILVAQVAVAQDTGYGEAEYAASCAVCHGTNGRGDGPLAGELRSTPADLTALASSNGGEFPYWRIVAIIDGRYVVPGHGTREMPVWGREFLSGDTDTFGPEEGRAVTQERINALAAYLATLQE